MDLALKDLGEYIEDSLSEDVLGVSMRLDELMVTVRREAISKVLTFLRDDPNCQFKQLMDVTAVDFPDDEDRFEVVYNLLSMTHNNRVRIKLRCPEDETVASAVPIFSSANWWEREVFDLFGIFFTDHPDLRRIMTDYGFEGHPLRKDFPLTGYTEVRYDEEQKRVVYEPVKLAQEFRNFDFVSPWEGIQGKLPGDEKAEETEGNA
ncbi:MAG: NADH-quinone oxidoreductase subunit C [Magnetovibrionaceae bacterium]